MRNDTHAWRELTASVFQIRIQIRIWLALFAFAPMMVSATAHDEAALAAAQRFANEFAIAQAGGADLSKIRGVRTAIEELTRGVQGRGRHATLIFRVEDVPRAVADHAITYLSYDRSVLRYRAPIHYTEAWTVGSIKQERVHLGASLNRLLAERTAQSFARTFGAARAASAPLSEAIDVGSAMSLLEKGVYGEGAYAATKFHVPATKNNLRFIAKKLLRFEGGTLHYVKDADRMSRAEVEETVERKRPAQLAQQVVATYNTAIGFGAEFKNVRTPADIIDKLRLGEHVNNELGSQSFRISTDAPEEDWAKSVAYLRFKNGMLSYVPPS